MSAEGFRERIRRWRCKRRARRLILVLARLAALAHKYPAWRSVEEDALRRIRELVNGGP